MIPEHQQVLYINLISKWKVPYGKAVYCVGNTQQLGQWSPKKSHKLTYIAEDIWHTTLQLKPTKTTIQYKYFLSNYEQADNNNIIWQAYEGNRTINLSAYTDKTPQKNIVSVCSFNIRFLTQKDKNQNHWENRKKPIVEYLRDRSYDVVGIQEATLPQRLYLQDGLKDYDYYGRSRDLAKDQQCGIFVLKDKYTVVSDQYEWISADKQEGAVGYDAKLPRYFTTLVITPKITYSKHKKIPCITIINTHLDHIGQIARKRGIEQIIQKSSDIVRAFSSSASPYTLTNCIVMGDLNLSADHKYLAQFTNNTLIRFVSMRDIQGADQGFTFNGFQNKYLLNLGSFIINKELTIDHMYFWRNEEDKDGLQPVEFIVDRKSEKYLSDHFPIIGRFSSNL